MKTEDDRSFVGRSGRSAETDAREAERKKRLAAALRENLKRRKGPAAEPEAPSRDDAQR